MTPKSLWAVTAAIRHLLLERKAMMNLDSVKSRDVTWPTKVSSKLWYRCDRWTIKKAEH